jgi:CBS domain-containing protein
MEMAVLVKDVMSRPAITVEDDRSAKYAGELMRKNRKGFLVVVHGSNPVGVISDSDLINKIVAKGNDSNKFVVKDLMNRPLITVSPAEEITEAVKKMKKNNIHRLPVVDREKVVGVLSLTDIARSSPEMFYLLEYRQEMKKHPIEIKEKMTAGICDSCDNFSDHLKKTANNRWLCESCIDEEADEY